MMFTDSSGKLFWVTNIDETTNMVSIVLVNKTFGVDVGRHEFGVGLNDVNIDFVAVLAQMVMHELYVRSVCPGNVLHNRILASGDNLNTRLIVFMENGSVTRRQNNVPNIQSW